MKIWKSNIIAAMLLLIAVVQVRAIDIVSVRVQSPNTPTNDKEFRLSFVTMDLENRSVSVRCFIKGPSTDLFTQFDSMKTVSPGGNSGHCQVTADQISPLGTYQFYATAQAGSDTATSNTVLVEYDNSHPGKLESYSKEKTADCTFRLTFKTADDGKTAKVEVYRSNQTTFDLNSSTRVGEIALGPSQAGEFVNTVPDCSKTYYYALMAFDSVGNPSDPVGDAAANFTTTTDIKSPTQGAIPIAPPGSNSGISSGQSAGSILGESDEEASQAGDVINAETSPNSKNQGLTQGITDQTTEKIKQNSHTVMVAVGSIVLAALAYYFFRKTAK